MAGHNKWSKIKRKKGANDAKMSKIYSKLIKEIQVAVKLSGPDPETNPRLRVAIQNSKGQNMPKDNIERAIKKASGEDGANYEEVTYEGYAPHGVAIFIEATTDNTNRTVADVRSYFNKVDGSLAKSGSLDFIFDQKGVFVFPMPEGMEKDELELELIDAGAEEIDVEDGTVSLTTAREDFGSAQEKLEEMGIETEEAGLKRIPKIFKKIEPDQFKTVLKLIDLLEDNDDVQNVYHNVELTEELEAVLEEA